jgi:hypothetical protein
VKGFVVTRLERPILKKFAASQILCSGGYVLQIVAVWCVVVCVHACEFKAAIVRRSMRCNWQVQQKVLGGLHGECSLKGWQEAGTAGPAGL